MASALRLGGLLLVLALLALNSPSACGNPISDSDLSKDELIAASDPPITEDDVPVDNPQEDPVEEPPAGDDSPVVNDPSTADDVPAAENSPEDSPAEEKKVAAEELPIEEDEGSGDDLGVIPRFQDEIPEKPESVCKKDFPVEGYMAVSCDGKLVKSISDLNIDVNVIYLSLSDNSIEELSESSFPDKLNDLKDLRISNNELKTINKAVFDRLPHLERMDLSGNGLTTLKVDMISGLSLLQELHLARNPLQLPAEGPFIEAPSLLQINMADCNLTNIPESTFEGMKGLNKLDLRDNPIDPSTPLTASVFAPLANLSRVILPEDTPQELANELCSSHELLRDVCIQDPCHACDLEAIVHDDDAEGSEKDTPAVHKRKKANLESPDSAVPESSRSGVKDAGSNTTILALVVGAVVGVIICVALKKNWKRIQGRWEVEQVPPQEARPVQQLCAPEEMVPLNNKTPQA